MKFASAITQLLLAASAAVAAPATELAADSDLAKRATTYCDSYGSFSSAYYTFYHNNWGASAGSGSQCTTFSSTSGRTVGWSTSWSWSGGSSNVKSYSNVAITNVNKKLSAVKSIASVWKWSYTGSNIVADVAYDLWLAPTSGGTNKYEIMVWLAALGGAGPISSTGKSVGSVTVGGVKYAVYSGPNGDTTVFSFVAQSTVTSFSGDLMDFFDYLVANQGVSNSMYITSLQAGTEPFTGSKAVMTTSAYSMVVA